MKPQCPSHTDGAYCEKKVGHKGHHADGGYIWEKDDEMSRYVRKLKKEIRDLKAKLADALPTPRETP